MVCLIILNPSEKIVSSYRHVKYILFYCYILILYILILVTTFQNTFYFLLCYQSFKGIYLLLLQLLLLSLKHYERGCSNLLCQPSSQKTQSITSVFSDYFLSIVSNIENIVLTMLSTFRVAIVSPTDPVCVAAQKMKEFRVNSVVVATGNTLQGIFT
jgi:hypothetical protein